MERRGSLYFSSEHTAYSPVNFRGTYAKQSTMSLKGRVKNLRFSHALHNVITYEIISFYKGTLVILTVLPAQHLMAILCDEYHDFPLC